MKKILSFILIIVISIIFAISVSARTPPPRVIIRSEDELIELRRIAEAGEEAFTRSGHRELITYGEVISFLVLVDSLLIPHGEGMRFTGLIYSPGNNYYHIFFESRGDERHSYYFDLSEERGEGIVERMFGSVVSLLYENKDEGLRVYSPPPSWGSFPDETGGYRFAMEINGFFMRAGYSPGRSSTHVTAESVYGGMTVTTIRDLTWIDRNQPGDIFSEGFVTTANALEILRFVAGLEHDIRSQSAMAAADVNGDGKIDTADALEVLRIVAGLA